MKTFLVGGGSLGTRLRKYIGGKDDFVGFSSCTSHTVQCSSCMALYIPKHAHVVSAGACGVADVIIMAVEDLK